MTETPEKHFRCPKYVDDAIAKEMAEKNRKQSEVILRAICKGLKIKYEPVTMGRPKKDPK